MKNVLAFGAHPDDIELGCAGTLLKHNKVGHNIYLCVLSSGQAAGDPLIRTKEQEESAKRLKAKELIWGDWIDTRFDVSEKKVAFIENVINKIQPYEIYVNHVEDSHQDHRALAQCVISASRYSKRILLYEDYTSLNFNPDIFVDIEDVLEEKIKVMNSFQSQVSKWQPSGQTMIDNIHAVANFRGFQAKVNFAEAFKALRYLKLDF